MKLHFQMDASTSQIRTIAQTSASLYMKRCSGHRSILL